MNEFASLRTDARASCGTRLRANTPPGDATSYLPRVTRLLMMALSIVLVLAGARSAGSQSILEQGRNALRWPLPSAPVHIVGPLYFVGTQGLGCWLFATSEGLILLNTGLPGSGPMIAHSIRQLGLNPADVRILLIGHPHLDHAGSIAWFKEKTGALLAVMDEDVASMSDGGRRDFHYRDYELSYFRGAAVDRILTDGATVRSGEVVLTAHKTPGHTPGATTWTTTLYDGSEAYEVAFLDGTSVNPGYRLVSNRFYADISDDYRATFERLSALEPKPSIWFAHHSELDDFALRRDRAAREGVSGWVNGDTYLDWVVERRAKFDAALKRQQ